MRIIYIMLNKGFGHTVIHMRMDEQLKLEINSLRCVELQEHM